jgi:hypothetical protein
MLIACIPRCIPRDTTRIRCARSGRPPFSHDGIDVLGLLATLAFGAEAVASGDVRGLLLLFFSGSVERG